MHDIAAELAALNGMTTGDLAKRYHELHGQSTHQPGHRLARQYVGRVLTAVAVRAFRYIPRTLSSPKLLNSRRGRTPWWWRRSWHVGRRRDASCRVSTAFSAFKGWPGPVTQFHFQVLDLSWDFVQKHLDPGGKLADDAVQSTSDNSRSMVVSPVKALNKPQVIPSYC